MSHEISRRRFVQATAAMGIAPDDRRKRMVENMHVMRHLWTKDNEPFEGRFVKFAHIRPLWMDV